MPITFTRTPLSDFTYEEMRRERLALRAAARNHSFPNLVDRYGDVTLREAITSEPGFDGRALRFEDLDPDS